jgi:hypothetical protein
MGGNAKGVWQVVVRAPDFLSASDLQVRLLPRYSRVRPASDDDACDLVVETRDVSAVLHGVHEWLVFHAFAEVALVVDRREYRMQGRASTYSAAAPARGPVG